jgi:hypothetical protein
VEGRILIFHVEAIENEEGNYAMASPGGNMMLDDVLETFWKPVLFYRNNRILLRSKRQQI